MLDIIMILIEATHGFVLPNAAQQYLNTTTQVLNVMFGF